MIVVTGGAGFIASNLVHTLNQRGVTNIVVVDDLSNGHKFHNLVSAQIVDFVDPRSFQQQFASGDSALAKVELVYHLGACTDTTEWNGQYMLESNFSYSKALLAECQRRQIPFIYASSAAIYGSSAECAETPRNEHPLNVYGYSKLLFDQHVRRVLPNARARIVGLRYFNVYGPHEQHKGRMASVAYHFDRQLREHGVVRLFGASHGVAAGEQQRDFIHVDDVVDVTLWAGEEAGQSGIFNCGTGQAATFNRVANAVLQWHRRGAIEYIPFPADLLAAYQSNTCADLTALRAAGYHGVFRPVESGAAQYLAWLNDHIAL